MISEMFKNRKSIEQVEESTDLAPIFDKEGLIPVVTTANDSGEVLMVGFMNCEALSLTIKTGQAHYWRRSSHTIWRKGDISGFVQQVQEIRIDDDQDSIWLSVNVKGGGASCHVGYRSCFYRSIPFGKNVSSSPELNFVDTIKIFDPKEVYGDLPNPTRI